MKRQPSVAFRWILQVERYDRLLFPILQPKVPPCATLFPPYLDSPYTVTLFDLLIC
jgi:hypothetical protein